MKFSHKMGIAISLMASNASLSLAQAPTKHAVSHAEAVRQADQVHAEQRASKARKDAKVAEYHRTRAVRIEAANQYHAEQRAAKAREDAKEADARRARAARIEAAHTAQTRSRP